MPAGHRGTKQISCRSYPRSARLGGARDFKRVFARPVKSADAYFTVLASVVRPGSARLGLAISKRQVRRAVDRNRLKRLARETFRRRRLGLPAADFIVMAQAAALGIENRRLIDSLERHLDHISDKLSG